MKRYRRFPAGASYDLVWLFLATSVAVLLLPACRPVDRETLDVAGIYRNPNGSGLVDRNSGRPVTMLNLSQRGHRLEAVDNHGAVYSGKVGQASDTQAQITLEGVSSANVSVTIAGTVTIGGQTAVLRGTWIEDALTGTIHGTATVTPRPDPPAPTNNAPGALRWLASPAD